MPLGIQRLNARRSQPNDRIVFIKPLNGPDEKTAQDFLERIAAQCCKLVPHECGLPLDTNILQYPSCESIICRSCRSRNTNRTPSL
jgi:hypothetical protein